MDTKKPTIKEDSQAPETPEKEVGGYEKMLEPTRYGAWEVKGRCSDF